MTLGMGEQPGGTEGEGAGKGPGRDGGKGRRNSDKVLKKRLE